MYLTRFRVNTARLHARKLLSSPQVLHAAVMTSFAAPPPADGENGRVLWRLDRAGAGGTHLFIVSPDRPDLTHFVEQAGWPTTGGWDTFDYAPLLARIRKGDRWAFRLTANPVHSVRNRDGAPTKPTAHVGSRHQLGWLLKHQVRAGFSVAEKPVERRLLAQGDEHDVLVHGERRLSFVKNGRPAVSLVTITYDGHLEVTDPDALRHALTHGLGRAKAYGCGLLTLAPA